MKNNTLFTGFLSVSVVCMLFCNSCNTIIPQQTLLNEPYMTVLDQVKLAIHSTHTMAGIYGKSKIDKTNSYFINCYELKGGKWINIQKIDLPYIPKSIAIYDNYAVVGQSKLDSCKASVYVFRNGTWNFVQDLFPADSTEKTYPDFGESVDIYKDYIVVGSPYVDKKGSVKGYAYIYKLSNFEWNQVAKLKTINPTTLYHFGAQVQIDENVCIVKSIKTIDNINTNYQLHVFKKIDDANWNETDILHQSNDLITPFFAQDFDLYGQNIIASAQNSFTYSDSVRRYSTYFYTAPKGPKYVLNAKYINHSNGSDVAVNAANGYVSNSDLGKNLVQTYKYENGSFTSKHTIVQPKGKYILEGIKSTNDYLIYYGKTKSANYQNDSSYLYFFKL
jgi:hypothetical protein